ncbi:histidinol-phosphatase [Marinobacterium nitratireducens]|uniref:Histidinol-phosphatase n=1 Tax=Marinobacterium nitratireducens TaxID=518897 RepID=A0A918DVH1_9GAMM|nr:histidinol-phosphatase [Marinobacterium nitratireducens]GGO84232.1 histidinol-phosphatase [Marinobacterium nitratireducens]
MTTLSPADLANRMADRARAILKPYFRTRIQVQDKADTSPVTIADRDTEAALRELLLNHFPHHNIIGEEHGQQQRGSDFTWVIDPIDGTKSFISGMPTFGTLISLQHDDRPLMGLIDIPFSDERWLAQRGQGTRCNGQICRTSGVSELREAILYSTEPDPFSPSQLQRFNDLARRVKLRRFGGDCYLAGLLASGHIDLLVEAGLKVYDVMAMVTVIEEAGGCISDWHGQAVGGPNWDGSLLASASATLHRQALSVLQAETTTVASLDA